jgi:uncharacterized protein (TIGR03545 family)
MAKKVPGFYKKSLSQEKLNKRYLRFIEHDADRSFISSIYNYKEEDGVFVIRTDLEKDEVKRLKVLKRDIKKNRKGPIRILPLAAATALIAGAVFFFTVLLNPILERALEAGLETIFEAKADVSNFRLSLIKFEISLDGLTIADRDSPMANLIQCNRMAIRLRPDAVLRGKVYIEEIRADAIRFGTPRTVSGALPEKPAKQKPPKEKTEIPPLVDLENFDAMALLNREFEKLQTPKLYDTVIAAYDTAIAKWNTQIDSAKARAENLEQAARPLLNINIDDYRTLDQNTIQQIQARINEVNTLINSVQEAGNVITAMVSGIEEDMQTVSALEQNARNSFNSDFAYLQSFLDISSGPATEILESVIREILTDSALSYLELGERGLEILEKVKALQQNINIPSGPPKESKEKYRGRDVIFPVRNYPQFFLGTLASDVYTPGDWHWVFDLRGVSSDPDLSGVPVSLVLGLSEGADGRKASFNGMADFRSNANRLFNAEFEASGFAFSLGLLSDLGVGGFSGDASFGLDLGGASSGAFSGGASVSIFRSRLLEPSNTFAQAVDSALQKVNSLDLGIRFEHSSSNDSFSVNTNIGNLILDALKDIAIQYIRMAEEELERVLREKISSYIDESVISKDELDTLFAVVRGDKAAMDQLRQSLNNKLNEFEQRVRSAAEDAARQAVDEAVRQGTDALQDALQGITPSTPSLPNIPGNPFGGR